MARTEVQSAPRLIQSGYSLSIWSYSSCAVIVCIATRSKSRMYCRVSSMILGLSSFPSRLCPAITARGLSDSILSSAAIHSRRVCAFDQAKHQHLGVEIDIPLWIRSDRRHMMYSGNWLFHRPFNLFQLFEPLPDMRKPSTFWIRLEPVLVDFQ